MDRAFVSIVAVIWLGALVFYWSVDAHSDPNRATIAEAWIAYQMLWGLLFLVTRASSAELARRFLLSTAAILLVVSTLELLVIGRAVDFRVLLATPIREPWRNPRNLLDPKLLHIHRPYERVSWRGIEYRFDRHGLRNETELGTADVVVLGDSFILGWHVAAEHVVTTQLAARLRHPVANLSQEWYGPQQQLELLRRFGIGLRPRACVWSFFEGNDLSDLRRYNDATRNWAAFSRSFHAFPARSFTRNAAIAARRLSEWIRGRRGANGDADDGWLATGVFRNSSGVVTMYFWYPGHHLSDEDQLALDELRGILRDAHALCRSIGATFLVMFIPTNSRVYGELTEFDVTSPARYWIRNDLPERLETIVRETLPASVFLDLTQALTDHASRGEVVYIPNDGHWSPEGHRIAAAAIADALNQRME